MQRESPREADAPLKHPTSLTKSKGRDAKGESKRGEASIKHPTSLTKGKVEVQGESPREVKPLLYTHSPFPLLRGRGIKGDRVTPKQKSKGSEVNKQSN